MHYRLAQLDSVLLRKNVWANKIVQHIAFDTNIPSIAKAFLRVFIWARVVCMYCKCPWYGDIGGLRNQLQGHDFAFHCELLLACPPARVESCGCAYDWICLSLYCPSQRKTKSVLCPRELVKFEAHRLAHPIPTGSRHQPTFET